MAVQPADWRDGRHLLSVCVEGEVLRHLPDKDLAIIGRRGNDPVVERTPESGLDWRSHRAADGARTSLCPAQRQYGPGTTVFGRAACRARLVG